MKKTTVHQVTQLSFLPRLFPVNVYLVEEADGLTLIDAGMPFSLKGILNAADSLGKPITRILLTHAHGDHVGALDGLKEALPNAEVLISRRDQALLAKQPRPGSGRTANADQGGRPAKSPYETGSPPGGRGSDRFPPGHRLSGAHARPYGLLRYPERRPDRRRRVPNPGRHGRIRRHAAAFPFPRDGDLE